MKKKAALLYVVLGSIIIIFLAGCATAPSTSSTVSQDNLLRQAGFRTHSAQDEHVAYIKTLPAKKVVSNKYQGQAVYMVCTDPDAKQCFVGDQAAYDRYQQLAIQQAISEDQRNVQENRSDPEAWTMWMDSQGGG